jgi:hypothetical protein
MQEMYQEMEMRTATRGATTMAMIGADLFCLEWSQLLERGK